MPAGTIKFSFTIGVQHTQSYRTTSAAVCRGSSCKEVTRELIASTNGERDGNSVSGAVGVTAGDKLEVTNTTAAAAPAPRCVTRVGELGETLIL